MYDKPKNQTFHVSGIQHIAPTDAWEMLQSGKAVLLDVREPFELGHQKLDLPDEHVLHIPMMTLIDRLDEVPMNQTILVLCVIGERSAKITNLLKHQGFTDVVNVDGGLCACRESGLPFSVYHVSDCDCEDCNGNCC